MTVRIYTHSIAKRAEAIALVDSGATENFMNLNYAKWLKLPIKNLDKPHQLFNVDGTENKTGMLKHYTDIEVQTGTLRNQLRFFLSDLGEHKAILGYSWFAAVQPKIDWKQGWIDSTQLPIILRAPDAKKAWFLPHTVNAPCLVQYNQYFIGRVTIDSVVKEEDPKIPNEYMQHRKVFSEYKSQCLPQHTIWDHAIELLPGAPTTLPRRLLPLTQAEIEEASKFVQEHLARNTIRPSWSPYAANFFFVKKKDGKLCPVQDYQPLNKWTKWNCNVSPLIPSVIDRLAGCTLFTKFNVWWGYNNIQIKPGDEWKAAFLTPEGLFEPTVMFFGLTNSPAMFQMMMNTIFRSDVAKGDTSVFMDDIAIHTKKYLNETHKQHLAWHRKRVHEILDKLEANDLYLKPEKCAFKQDEIEYLGVIVGKVLWSWALSSFFRYFPPFILCSQSLVPHSFPYMPLRPPPNHLTSHLMDHLTILQSDITCHHSAVRSTPQYHYLTLHGLPAHCHIMMRPPAHDEAILRTASSWWTLLYVTVLFCDPCDPLLLICI